MNFQVRANAGVVYVTYPIQQVKDPAIINDVLSSFKDAREIVLTEAQTNILWIQEKFNAGDDSYKNVISLANKWNAAVELIKMTTEVEPDAPVQDVVSSSSSESWRQTGIIEEPDGGDSTRNKDMSDIYEKLINDGRAGGKRLVAGSQKTLMTSIDRSINYRLIIFDNVFLSKSASARKRLAQEWSTSLSDSLKIPIISLDEMRSRYKFGPKQFFRMIIYGLLTAAIVYLLFSHSREVITFLSQTSVRMRIIAAIAIPLFIPIFAYIYSTVTSLFLKMIKLD